MCGTCGCQDPHHHQIIRKPSENHIQEGQHQNVHEHKHGHSHDHEHHEHAHGTEINLEQDILAKNNLLAERNRGFLEAKGVFTLNLVSSPGAGKTTLLERTIRDTGSTMHYAVIEGDQQTMNDARRIEKAGADVVQVNTGSGCHLDAHMVNHAMKKLALNDNTMLLIENVGNLVCPSLFDLGETRRVVVISVTEGDDKPQKYPYIFESSDICIINKTDLLPYVEFDTKKFKKYAAHLNKSMTFFEVSATTGKGLDVWFSWLKEQSGASG